MDIAALCLITLVLVLSLLDWGSGSRIDALNRRISQLERKVDLLLEHNGIASEEPGMERVHELLRQDKKIQAIKVYRELTGAGLKEAKDAVEQM